MNQDEDLYQQTLVQYNDPEYARKYAANIADRIDEWMFEEFLAFVPQAASVLDVGCAAGRDTGYLNAKGYQVTGVDLSGELIRLARQKYPQLNFIEADFTQLQFDDDSFDAIWCKASLVHLPSQVIVKKALSEFWRVLKVGGHIMILTKAREQGKAKTASKVDLLSRKERYFRYQEKQEFLDLCKGVGFDVLQSKLYNEKDLQVSYTKRHEMWLFVIARKNHN